MDNQPIAAASLPGVRVVLDMVIRAFGLTVGPMPHQRYRRQLPRKDDRERRAQSSLRTAWEQVERQQNPTISEEEMRAKWDAIETARARHHAEKDRTAFRRDKQRKRT